VSGRNHAAKAQESVSARELATPLARAINIYCRLSNRELENEICRDVARHMRALAGRGVDDPNSLTVHGLSYLRRRDQERPPAASDVARSTHAEEQAFRLRNRVPQTKRAE
jgi:hypothetical protein